MCLAPELEQALLLELHLCHLAVCWVANIHDATMVDVELAHDDVVDAGSHLRTMRLVSIAPFRKQNTCHTER